VNPTLSILHTNDLHGRLRPEQVERLRARRSALGSGGLLLDAGDAISSGNVTFRPAGEPILDAMSAVGYDAMAIGNREFHVSQLGFRAKLFRARFPALCANLRPRTSGIDAPVHSHVRFTLVDGIRVAVFGVTVPMVTERMRVQRLSAYLFEDPVATARRLAAELRPECDVLVCLSHVGDAVDTRIAESAPGIDLIVGGHSHTTLPEGRSVNGVLIVQAGSHARHLGVVQIEIAEGTRRLSANLQEL
jgi:2',3'-cyclic-nucleotide 2'-phosphodiesterase (5'-nucleotidase family)